MCVYTCQQTLAQPIPCYWSFLRKVTVYIREAEIVSILRNDLDNHIRNTRIENFDSKGFYKIYQLTRCFLSHATTDKFHDKLLVKWATDAINEPSMVLVQALAHYSCCLFS